MINKSTVNKFTVNEVRLLSLLRLLRLLSKAKFGIDQQNQRHSFRRRDLRYINNI